MLFAGALFSAVAIFLGIFTKLPQGGGGLINNLMVLSCFYSAPPLLPPPPPPRAFFLDLDSSVFEIKQYSNRNLQSTGNFSEGPVPSPLAKPRAATGSKSLPTPNSTFSLPSFTFPAFSLLIEFCQLCVTIGEIVMVFFALCLPWLQMYFLHMTVSVRKTAGTPLLNASGFEQKFWQIKSHHPLLDDLKLTISERDKALVELMRITKKAKEEEKKALEREHENAESVKGLRKEREDQLAELARSERNSGKLQKVKEDEIEGLKKEITKQARAWEEKEKEWLEDKAADAKRNKEEKDSLEMERKQEKDSWAEQVKRLAIEGKREKEGMETKLKNVLEGMENERERWATERKGWRKEKEDAAKAMETIEAERKMSEEKTNEEKKTWEEADDRAQGRIVALEDEKTRLTNEAVERAKLDREREAARKASEAEKAGEQKRWEDELQAEAKNATSKLEEEILNGRKLIEGLQSDKRRDRQLLLELRAQLVRPTHGVPPTHMNPLRFGGSVQEVYGAPFFISSPASPKGTLLPIFPSNPPQAAVNQDVDSLFDPPPPRPMIRLPPPPPHPGQPIPAQIPAPSSPPLNAPKGPKGWTPGPSGGA